MTTSRRNFLKNGTLGALAAGVSLGITETDFGRAALSSTAPRLLLDRAAFESQLRTDFLIGITKVSVRLIEVLNLGSKQGADGKKEAFTLTFRGDNRSPLKQETYMIEHDRLGTFSLFLVPVVSRDKSAKYYEAVINRLYS